MLQIMYSAINNVIFVSSAHLGQRVSPLSGTNPVEHGDFDTLPIVASSYSRLVFRIRGLCMWVVFRHHIGRRIEALCRQVGAIFEVQEGRLGVHARKGQSTTHQSPHRDGDVRSIIPRIAATDPFSTTQVSFRNVIEFVRTSMI